jgi:hypothetical protein
MTRGEVFRARFRVPVHNFFKRVKRFRSGIFLDSRTEKTGIAAQKPGFANSLKIRVFSFYLQQRWEFSLSIENSFLLEVSERNSSYFSA